MRSIYSAIFLLLIAISSFAQDGAQQFASLGDLKLESGEVLRDCRVGYRTFGKLAADKSNAILFPTWFSGTTKMLVGEVGPGKLVDPATYFVITVDALSNGVSSSPSNSKLQPRQQFPKITIRDMVNSQYRLLTEVLHVSHLKAVMGDSMGGMQTFQWMVSYPDFMDKAIPIVGSPRVAAYDLLLWRGEMEAVKSDPKWKDGNYSEQPGVAAIAYLETMTITTPADYNKIVTREKIDASIKQAKEDTAAFDGNDRVRQLEAIMGLDVSMPFGGSMEKAAAAVKAKVLVIVGRNDHTVTPGPALTFAKLLNAEVLELQGDCGHVAPDCEIKITSATIARFLAK